MNSSKYCAKDQPNNLSICICVIISIFEAANNITDNGIQYIKDERWGSLKYLNLANNKIGD